MSAQPDRTIAAWLALLLFGIYLLSFSGRFHATDGMLMFSVADSFVKRGEFNSDQMWTLYKARNELAPDGESYAKTGYGTSLFAVPLYALALIIPGIGLAQTTILTSAIATALTAALLFLAARRLKFSRGASSVVVLLFGLATPAWVYAKQFWSEPISLFTLFATFYFLLCFRDESRLRDALFAGIALELAVATRLTNAALVPLFMWYGFSHALRDARARRGLAVFTLILALAVLSIAWYNWVRYGSPLSSGYRGDEGFSNPLLLGLYGLLFSPGKGLFVYVPFFGVLPWSLSVFYPRARRELIFILATMAVYLLTFATWYIWWGGTAWGPRFLVPLLPFLVLLIAPAIELIMDQGNTIRQKAHRALSVTLAALCALSFAIELLGISIPPLAHHLRMARISTNPEADTIFQLQFSPLAGYFDLLKPRSLDFAWIRAEGSDVSVDWLIIVLMLAFVVFCAVSLRGAIAIKPSPNHMEIASLAVSPLIAMFVLAAVLSLFSLYRYRDDARFGGNNGYRALLQTVQREAQPEDVMILDDDALTPFFLNENRARMRWYGLSRDPAQWDNPTRALLARLSQHAQEHSARIWFAFDDSTAQLPDPTRAWLEQSLHQVAQHDFVDGVHLMLFTAKTSP